MFEPPSSDWFSRFLFTLTVVASAGLILLVILAPFLDNGNTPPGGPSQVICLFAKDRLVRRTAIASSLGLLVTACVFFRPVDGEPRKTKRNPRSPPPPDIAGA
jgi:hypothetical protein